MFNLDRFKYVHLDEIDSTNSEAKRRIASGDIDQPTIIHADIQTGGRGSSGRLWASTGDNMQVSYVIPVERVDARGLLVVYPLALATSHLIRRIVGRSRKVSLKWPNDVLVDGKKVSGTLNEVETKKGKIFLIAGIGINLRWAPELPDSIYTPAALTEFVEEIPTSKEAVLELASFIHDEIEAWLRTSFDDVRKRYLAEAHGLLQNIAVRPRHSGALPVEGIYAGINEYGALELDEPGGRSLHYTADVFPTMERLVRLTGPGATA